MASLRKAVPLLTCQLGIVMALPQKESGRGKMQALLWMTKLVAKRLAIETAACVLFLALAGVMPVLSNSF